MYAKQSFLIQLQHFVCLYLFHHLFKSHFKRTTIMGVIMGFHVYTAHVHSHSVFTHNCKQHKVLHILTLITLHKFSLYNILQIIQTKIKLGHSQLHLICVKYQQYGLYLYVLYIFCLVCVQLCLIKWLPKTCINTDKLLVQLSILLFLIFIIFFAIKVVKLLFN